MVKKKSFMYELDLNKFQRDDGKLIFLKLKLGLKLIKNLQIKKVHYHK